MFSLPLLEQECVVKKLHDDGTADVEVKTSKALLKKVALDSLAPVEYDDDE
jgi:hypothetical protein